MEYESVIDELFECGDKLPENSSVMILHPEAYLRFCLDGVCEDDRPECLNKAKKTLEDLGNPPLVQVDLQQFTVEAVSLE